MSGPRRFRVASGCIGIILGLAWRRLRRRHLCFTKVPGWPLLGVLPYMRGGEKLIECAELWAKEYGGEGVFEFSLAGQRIVVCCSHSEAQQVLAHRPFRVRRTKLFQRFRSLLNGVFNAEGYTWSVHRRLTAPAFNAANTRSYFKPVHAMVDVLVGKLSEEAKDGRVANFSELLCCFSADVLSKVAFGCEFGALSKGKSKELDVVTCFFKAVQSRALAPFEWWKLPLLGWVEGAQTVSDQLSEMMISFIDSHEQSGMTNTVLSTLMHAEGEKLTRDELVGNMKTLFLAGTITIRDSLAWAFYHLSQHHQLQEQMVQELNSKARDGIGSIEHLEQLDLVRAVWAETLRFRSAVPYLLLSTTEPLSLAGRQVPPGSEIMLLTRYYQDRVPEAASLGSDLDEFRPGRWLVDGMFKQDPALDPLAFGYGARACLGRRLADLEGQLTIAEVVRHFQLVEGAVKLGETTSFSQGPDKDIELKLAPRLIPQASGCLPGTAAS